MSGLEIFAICIAGLSVGSLIYAIIVYAGDEFIDTMKLNYPKACETVWKSARLINIIPVLHAIYLILGFLYIVKCLVIRGYEYVNDK